MNDTHDPECAVDFARLREVTGDDEQLQRDITDQYLAQAEQILVEIEAAIEDEDQVRVSQLAHKLAGSSAMCGMEAILASLESLESLQPYVNSEALELLRTATQQLERIRHTLNQPTSPQN